MPGLKHRRRAVVGTTALATWALAVAPSVAMAARGWHALPDLPTAEGSAPVVGSINLAMDHTGDAIAIWQERASSSWAGSFRPAQGAFSAPFDVPGGALAMNDAGDAVVVGGSTAATRPAGGFFSSPVQVPTGGYHVRAPDVAIDHAGTVTVVWEAGSEEYWFNTILAATRLPGQDFSAPVVVASGVSVSSPRAAVDYWGNTLVVWSDGDVKAALRTSDATSFSGPIRVSDDPSPESDSLDVAMSPAGDAIVAWSDYTDGIVRSAIRPAGSLFSAPQRLSAGQDEPPRPQVGISPSGDAVAVWDSRDTAGVDHIVQAATRPAGGSWSTVDVSARGRHRMSPQVTMDQAGNAIAVWDRFDGRSDSIEAATRPAGGSFSLPAVLASAEQSDSPQVAVTPSGDGLASWHSLGDGKHSMRAFLYEDVLAPPPPPCSDCDGDGFPAAIDCDDSNVAIHPGAREIARNNTDEDCSDGDGRYARLDSTIAYRYRLFGRYTKITALYIQPAPSASVIRLKCTGRGCLFKSKTRKVTQHTRRLNLSALVGRLRLRPRAQLEIRVSRPGILGIVRRISIRAHKSPTLVDRCLPPGARKTETCPP